MLTRREAVNGAMASLVASGMGSNTPSFAITPLAGSQDQGGAAKSRTAVVYLSRSGNTRVIAGQLQRTFHAQVFELRTASPWPEEYEAMVAWASRLHESGALPALAGPPLDLARFQTIFLGSPIWGSALPAPVKTFLSRQDLSGKTVVPFFTYGCCGTGDAMETIATLAPRAKLTAPFSLKCDQERDTMNSVDAWLRSAKSLPQS